MPLYDFVCSDEKCDWSDELLLKLSDYEKGEYNQSCPKCPDGGIVRSFTSMNFRLVGPNWFRDGYTSGIQHEHDKALKENDFHRKREDHMNETLVKHKFL